MALLVPSTFLEARRVLMVPVAACLYEAGTALPLLEGRYPY